MHVLDHQAQHDRHEGIRRKDHVAVRARRAQSEARAQCRAGRAGHVVVAAVVAVALVVVARVRGTRAVPAARGQQLEHRRDHALCLLVLRLLLLRAGHAVGQRAAQALERGLEARALLGQAREALCGRARRRRRAWPRHGLGLVRKKERQEREEEADQQALQQAHRHRRRCVSRPRTCRVHRLVAHVVDPLLLEAVRRLLLLVPPQQVAARRRRRAAALVELLAHHLHVQRRHPGGLPQPVKAARHRRRRQRRRAFGARRLVLAAADRALQVHGRRTLHLVLVDPRGALLALRLGHLRVRRLRRRHTQHVHAVVARHALEAQHSGVRRLVGQRERIKPRRQAHAVRQHAAQVDQAQAPPAHRRMQVGQLRQAAHVPGASRRRPSPRPAAATCARRHR